LDFRFRIEGTHSEDRVFDNREISLSLSNQALLAPSGSISNLKSAICHRLHGVPPHIFPDRLVTVIDETSGLIIGHVSPGVNEA
jgi:hypothetical protein